MAFFAFCDEKGELLYLCYTKSAFMIHSFGVSEQELFDFEELLKQHGLEIAKDSDLQRVSLNIIEVNEKFKKQITHDDSVDIRPYFSEVAGLNEFIRQILKHKNHNDFPQLIPHLRLLNEANSVSQTTKSKVTDGGNNKLFELYIALLCMSVGENIRLDSPTSAKGDNPDIMFDFNDASWAIACKAVHSKSELTLFDRLKEGVEQIDRSTASKGMVIVNFKNIVDYNLIWPIVNESEYKKGEPPKFATFSSAEIPASVLVNCACEYQKKLLNSKGVDNLKNLTKMNKCSFGFLVFLQSLTSVTHMGQSPVTLLKTLNLIQFDQVSQEYRDLSLQLNQAMHNRV